MTAHEAYKGREMLRTMAVICTASALAAAASGCAASHNSSTAFHNSSTASRGGTASQGSTAPGSSAPRWLQSLARREAASMKDPHPQMVSLHVGVSDEPPFTARGHKDVIEMWGRFACSPKWGCNLFPSCGPPVPPGGKSNDCTFHGTYARLVVGPRSHQIGGVELGTARGFRSIPHMKEISESDFRFCKGFKGTSPPSYCQTGGALNSAVDIQQVWKPRTGRAKSGQPSQVVVDVIMAPTAAVAKHYSPVYAHTASYTTLPTAAINGGIAGKVDSAANDGQTEFRFAWTSGSSMIEVNIVGPGLTLREATDVARRAVPR